MVTSEFSPSSEKTHFSNLLLSDLSMVFSLILSNPLYFFYFLFFFPYLFKLLCFLSPLVITTLLLLLVFVTVFPDLFHESSSSEFSESKVSFMLATFHALVERLKSNDGYADFDRFVELEVYKIVFDPSDFDIGENPIQILHSEGKENRNLMQVLQSESKENRSLVQVLQSDVEENRNAVQVLQPEVEENRNPVQVLQPEVEENRNPVQVLQSEVEENKNPGEVLQSEVEENSLTSDDELVSKDSSDDGSDNGNLTCHPNVEDDLSKMNYHQSLDSDSNELNLTIGIIGSFRSTTKERETRKTLACRLFEERQNGDGCEGMDMLWEKYETDSTELHGKSKSKKDTKVEYYDEEEEEYYDDEDDDDEMSNVQLCCLQALKFSAGRMRLGMGKSNILKISKALKGLRWVHRMSKGKKKGHH